MEDPVARAFLCMHSRAPHFFASHALLQPQLQASQYVSMVRCLDEWPAGVVAVFEHLQALVVVWLWGLHPLANPVLVAGSLFIDPYPRM